MAKDVGCSWSAVLKIWCEYKGKKGKGQPPGRPRKTAKHQDRKLKAIIAINKQYVKQMGGTRSQRV